jgi:hypothetical protein
MELAKFLITVLPNDKNRLRARSMNKDSFYNPLAAGCLKGTLRWTIPNVVWPVSSERIVRFGYLIDRCELKSANEYVITWKIPLQGTVKANFSCVVGCAKYEPVEPGFCSVRLLEDPMKTRVCPLACFRD